MIFTDRIQSLMVAAGFTSLGIFLAFNDYTFYSLLSYLNAIVLMIE